jgi:PAS domain S-box-containing protein
VVSQVVEDGLQRIIRTERLHKNGDPIPVTIKLSRMTSATGQVLGVCGTVFDQRGATCKQREDEHSAWAVRNSADAMITLDTEGYVTSWNPAAERMFEYSTDEILGQHIRILSRDESDHNSGQVLGKVLNEGLTVDVNTIRVAKSGRGVPVSMRVSPLTDENERRIGITGRLHDRTKEAIQQRELLKLESIINLTTDSVGVGSEEGELEFLNTALRELLGVSAKKSDQQPLLLDCFTASERKRMSQEVFPSVLSDGLWRGEAELAGGHDQVVPVSVVFMHLDGEDGKSPGRIGFVARDIRQHRKLLVEKDDALRQLSTLNDELESFNYSINHDLKAPLRVIEGFSTDLLETYGNELGVDGSNDLERVIGNAHRMSGLLSGLLDMSMATRANPRFEDIDVTASARRIASALQASGPERCARFSIAEGLSLRADPSLFDSVIANLLENAWKFTNTRAEALIGVGCDDDTIFVKDNGVGFDEAHSDRLFRPFQRLHRDSEFTGTGIGLATVHRIVQRHGGSVSARGEVGVGACFRFRMYGRGAQIA